MNGRIENRRWRTTALDRKQPVTIGCIQCVEGVARHRQLTAKAVRTSALSGSLSTANAAALLSDLPHAEGDTRVLRT